MKIYNINNTTDFFEKLAACRGEVELVDEKNGDNTLLQKQSIRETLVPLSCVQGTISEIQLIFHDHQDFDSIFQWVFNKCGIQ